LQSDLQRPGGLILLDARVSPLASRLMPAWAAVCGALASNAFRGERAGWVQLLLTVLLVDAGWGTLWAGIGGTDWASPLRRWREWPVGGKIAVLPFTQSGSRGDNLSRNLGQLRAWWRQVLWPTCGRSLKSICLGLVVTALLAAVVGTHAVLLSVAGLATMQLGAVLTRGSGSTSSIFDALIVVMLPWAAGHSGLAPLTPAAFLLPAVLALAYAGARSSPRAWARAVLAASIPAVGALIVAAGRPTAAVAACALLLPQLLLIPWLERGYPRRWVARYAQPWLMAAMLTAALAV
jgi:hypothetical protein